MTDAGSSQSRTGLRRIWRDWMWAPVGFFIAANGAALASVAWGEDIVVKAVVTVLALVVIYVGSIVWRWSYRG